ncbi:MAG TPA: glycosyltransferase, partial [Acidimicrobiia bacterium]|nr:glycosyltransferase [Acidimicrobiia bacterium]
MTSPLRPVRTAPEEHADLTVLYLIDHLASGGAEQILLRYLRHLHGNGVDARVTTIQTRDGNPLAADIAALGIPVSNLHIDRLRDSGARHRVRSHLAAVDPDLVHTQLEFSNVLGTLAASRLGIPTISTLHTLDTPGRWTRDGLRFRLMASVLRRRADRVIAVSDSARDHHLAVGRLRPEATITIHNGIDLDPFRHPALDARSRVRAEHDIVAGAPVLATVAVLREPKGIQHMLEALPRVLETHPDAVYLVVGDGPHRAELEGLAARIGITRSVRFAGSRRDVADHLAAADVFVLPSLTEALPTVVAEAMAASLPVIATTVGGIPEMGVQGETALLVEPASP